MDIILNDEGDVAFKSGDFIVSDAEAQHIQSIIESNKGDYKYDPTLGVDAQKRISGRADILQREIQFQLVRDGYKVRDVKIEVTNGTLNVYTNAQRN